MNKIIIKKNNEETNELNKIKISNEMTKLGTKCIKLDFIERSLISFFTSFALLSFLETVGLAFDVIMNIKTSALLFSSVGFGISASIMSYSFYNTVEYEVGQILKSRNYLLDPSKKKSKRIKKRLHNELNSIKGFKKSNKSVKEFINDAKQFDEYMISKKEILRNVSQGETNYPIWCDSIEEASRYSINIDGKDFEMGDKYEDINNASFQTEEEVLNSIEQETNEIEKIFDESVEKIEESQRECASQRLLLILKYRQLQLETLEMTGMLIDEIDSLEQEKAIIESSRNPDEYVFYNRKK